MSRTDEELFELAKNTVAEMGYALVSVDDVVERGRRVFRFTIDHPMGVRVADCAKVSRELGDLLDADFSFDAPYVLEVSSPGLDHALKREREYAHFAGRTVRLVLRAPLSGENVIVGTIVGARDGEVTIARANGSNTAVRLSAVSSARLAEGDDASRPGPGGATGGQRS